jgi:REP element-mobilizing transposase RayT
MPEAMPPVSADNHLYFFTSVTHKRLPVFRTDRFKQLLADAFDEARSSSGIKFFAYAIMPDHYHVITDNTRKPSEVLRYLNGISARRVIDHLKEEGLSSSLNKLKKEEKKDEYKYSLWEHHSNTFFITSESMLLQKVRYIHDNPVKESLAGEPGSYAFCSARYWNRLPLLENEPLEMDIKELSWRNPRF